jgi:hypothetical protein
MHFQICLQKKISSPARFMANVSEKRNRFPGTYLSPCVVAPHTVSPLARLPFCHFVPPELAIWDRWAEPGQG